MLGNIIEKILKSYLGQYLDGIERKYIHVGMFSGKFKVENVRIKQELIDLLEWPIKLQFSFVETFEVNFQITNFRSKPFRIEMSNIFMMVQPKEKKDWNLHTFNTLTYKQNWLEYYIQQFIQEQAKQEQAKQMKQGDAKGINGYIERLAAVVVDNIEICIKNVHLRFESQNPVYAWGITIGKIEAFTVDSQWKEKTFVDRLSSKDRDKPIHKLVQIKNFGFYWENSQAEMFANQNQDVIVEKMYEYVIYQAQADALDIKRNYNSTQYIVCFSVDLQLQMNFVVQKWDQPEFDMKISFTNIDIRIGHEQLKDMLGLSTLLSNYQYCMRIEKDKVKLKCQRPDYEHFKKITSNIRILVAEISNISSLLDGFSRNQINLKTINNINNGNPITDKTKNMEAYQNMDRETLKNQLDIKQDKLNMLKQELDLLRSQYWQFCFAKVQQFLMEKYYKECLKKILASKYPSVLKLVREKDFSKIYQYKILDSHQVRWYKKAIQKNDLEDLVRWSKIDNLGQKTVEKKQKEKNKKSIGGLFGFSKQRDSDDEDENKFNLARKLEKTKYQEAIDQAFPIKNANVRPKEYVWMQVEVKIQSGVIQISELIQIEQGKHPKYHDRNNKTKQIEEGVLIQWQDIKYQMLKRDYNFEILAEMRDLQMYLFTQQQDSRNQVLVPILKKLETISQDKKPLVYFRFEKEPINKPNTFFVLEAELQQIIFTYYPQKLQRIISWLDYQTQFSDQPQQHHEIQINQEEYDISMLKKEQYIVMRAPIIIIPLNQQSSNESECLVINFQELKFQPVDEQFKYKNPLLSSVSGGTFTNSGNNILQSPNIKPAPLSAQKNGLLTTPFQYPVLNSPINLGGNPLERQHSKTIAEPKKQLQHHGTLKNQKVDLGIEMFYEFYKVEATGITISYFSSINHLNNHLRFKNSTKYEEIVNNPIRKKGVIHDIVEKFNFSMELGLINETYQGISPDMPRTMMKSDISNITLNLTPYLYFTLNNISELFSTEDDITKVQEFLQLDKEILIKFSQEKGYLMKRGDSFKSWANYYVIFSGNFLYFFNNKNDDYYTYHIYFKHATIKAESSYDIGIPYCIKLTVKNKDIYLAANNSQEYRKWMRVLTKYQSIVHEEKEKKKKQFKDIQIADLNEIRTRLSNVEVPSQIQNEIDIKLNIQKVNIQIHQEFKKKTSLLTTNPDHQRRDQQDVSQWMDITLEQINLAYNSRTSETNLKVNLGSIKAIDQIHLYPQGYIESVAQSYPFIEDKTKRTTKNLMEFEFTQRTPTHPNFNNIEMDIKASIGSLYINWKPDTFKRILNFFSEQQEEQNKYKDRKEQSVQNQQKQHYTNKDYQPQESFSDFQDTKYKSKQKNGGSASVRLMNNPKGLKSKFNTNTIEEEEINVTSQANINSKAELILPEENQKNVPIKINITAQFEELQIILIHRTSDSKDNEGLYQFTALARIDIIQGNFKGRLYPSEMHLDANLRDLQVIDLTKYPDTQIEYNQFNIEGLKIFGRDDNVQGNVIKFSFVSFDDSQNAVDNKYTQDNIYSVIDIQINQLYLVYFQKPFLRLVNYWQQQLVAVLTNKYNSEQEPEENKNNTKDLLSQLRSPKFQNYRVAIDKPKIVLKSTPSTQEWVELNLGSITIKNSNYKKKIKELESDRKINFMWCEKIAIDCSEMSIFMKYATQEIRVSDNIHFNLEIETYPLFSYYSQYFKNKTDLGNQIEILGRSSSITLKISKHQFILIMNILNQNLDFDDGYDKYFIFNYEESKQQSSQVQTYIQIDFQEISLYLQDNNQKTEGNQGLISFNFNEVENQENYNTFKLSIQDAKFIYINEVSDYFEVQFHGKHLFGSYFLHKNENFLGEPVQADSQIGFLGDLGPIKSSTKDDKRKNTRVETRKQSTSSSMRNMRQSFIQRQISSNMDLLNNSEDQTIQEYLQQVKASVQMTFYKEGNTKMNITLTNSKLLINSYVIFSILNFIKIEDPNEMNRSHIKSYKTTEKKDKKLQPFVINLKTKDILIGVQSEPKEKQILTLSGKVKVLYEKNTANANHMLFHKQELSQNQENDESIAHLSSNNSSAIKENVSLKVTAKRLEVSNIQVKDFYEKKNDLLTKKRNIMKPTEFALIDQQFQCDCSEELKKIQNTQFLIDKAICHLSYKDLDLIYSSLTFQSLLKDNAKKFGGYFDNLINKQEDNSEILSIGSLVQKSNMNLPQFQQQQQQPIVNSEIYDSNYKSLQNEESPMNFKRNNFVKKMTIFADKQNDKLQSNNAHNSSNSQMHLSHKLNSNNIVSGVSLGQKSNVKGTQNFNRQSKRQESGVESSYSVSQMSKKVDKVFQNFRLIVKSVEVLVINDLNQSFIPMLHLNFQLFPEILYTLEDDLGKVEGVCIFELEYFNPSVGKMEPIIEEASFKMMYLFHEEKKQQVLDIEQNLNEQFGIKPIININISDRMIAVLYKSFKYWRKRLISATSKNIFDMHQGEIPLNMDQSVLHSLAIHPSAMLSRQFTKVIGTSVEPHSQREYVTLFSFHNMTGYPMVVKKLQQFQKRNFDSQKEIESDQENFAKTFESNYSVMAQFDSRGFETYYINDIKLDRERQDVYLWQQKKRPQDDFYGDYEQVEERQREEIENNKIIKENFNKDYIDHYTFKKYSHHFFLSQIKLDDVRKTIILSSCFVLQNLLQFKIKVKLENKNIGNTSFEIKPKKIGAIPLEFMDDFTSISIQGNSKNNPGLSSFSKPQSLLELFTLGINQSKEINHDPMLCLVRKQYDQEIKSRVMLVFDTLITFQNLLPLPLNIHIVYQQTEQSRIRDIEKSRGIFDKDQVQPTHGEGISLLPQQLYQENFASYHSKLEIKVSVVGYYQCASLLVYQKGAKENSYARQLVMKDSNEKEQIINIERVFNGGSVTVMFYCKACIINTTGLDIYVYKNEDKKKFEILQGQQIDVMSIAKEQQNHSNLYFVNNEQHSNYSEYSMTPNNLRKQKSLFDNYPQEQESFKGNKMVESSFVQNNQNADQFFHRVILMNESDEKLALSFYKPSDLKSSSNLSLNTSGGNDFAPFSIKGINIEEQDYVDLKILTTEQDVYRQTGTFNQVQKQKYLYDLAVRYNQHSLNNSSLYTKIFTIMPKTIIVNQSSIAFEICQTGTKDVQRLATKKRVIQKWVQGQSLSLQIRPTDHYEWSGEIPVEFIKTYHFYCHLKADSKIDLEKIQLESYLFMNASVEQGGPITYIMIRDIQGDDIPYLIINNCEDVVIKIKQQQEKKQFSPEISKNLNSQNKFTIPSLNGLKKSQMSIPEKKKYNFNKFIIFPQKSAKFAWQYPSQETKIQAKFLLLNMDEKQKVKPTIIDLQSINFEDQIIQEIYYGNRIVRVQQSTTFKGMTRIITFQEYFGNFALNRQKSINIFNPGSKIHHTVSNSQVKSSFGDVEEEEVSKTLEQIVGGGLSVNINFKEIGISFIANHEGKNKEINYILLKGIQTSFVQNKEIRDISLSVKFIQMDNNTDQEAITPINLTPQLYRSIMENEENKMLVFKLKQNHLAQAHCELYLAPLQLKIDQEYLQAIIAVNNNIQRILEEMFDEEEEDEFNVKYSVTKYLFESQKKRSLMEKNILKKEEFDSQASFFEDWRFNDLPEISTSIFIKHLQIGEILVGFSYHPSFLSDPDSFHLLNTFASVLGTAIGNIEDAPIHITRYEKKEVFDSQSGIQKQLIKNYKFQAIRQLFRILGSFEIIGNPVGFLTKIDDGFQDLVDKPIQGIQEGPLEFGIGISEGTSSLLKNGIAGTFQSINKMTGTISTGVSKFTMDQQYQEKRRRFMMRQPQNAIDGLEQAGISVYRGFSEGLTGIVSQPFEGAERDGITGFLLGTVKGLTGAIIKPITGILDATSKTAEGLSNTVTHFDDKANDERNRNPRAFYDFMGYYKRYSDSDALFRSLCLSNSKIKDIHIIDCVQIQEDNYLGISKEKVIIFNSKKLKVDKIIDPNMIDELFKKKNDSSSANGSKRVSQENSFSSAVQQSDYLIPSTQVVKNAFKVSLTYFYQQEILNIKSYPTSEIKKGIIELYLETEEKADQLIQKLKMVKQKNEQDVQRSNFDGSDFSVLSPKKQESFQ